MDCTKSIASIFKVAFHLRNPNPNATPTQIKWKKPNSYESKRIKKVIRMHVYYTLSKSVPKTWNITANSQNARKKSMTKKNEREKFESTKRQRQQDPKINGFYLRWSRAENNLHRFVHRYSGSVAFRLCAIAATLPLDYRFDRWAGVKHRTREREREKELALICILISVYSFRARIRLQLKNALALRPFEINWQYENVWHARGEKNKWIATDGETKWLARVSAS